MLAEPHPQLGDHADGVAELATATGRRLRLRGDELDELALAARLHDVGKSTVPDEILSKSAALDVDEWEVIRRHPAAGERILCAAPSLAGVARIVRSTHERIDGCGYPDGLNGDPIPIGAGIVAVCAACGAMISARPSATAHTPHQAGAELRRCAGAQFDRFAVDARIALNVLCAVGMRIAGAIAAAHRVLLLSREHRDALHLVASGVDTRRVSARAAVDAVARAVTREEPV
jgi:two-component system cell cycle response regulator